MMKTRTQRMIATKHKHPAKAWKEVKLVRRDSEGDIMQRQMLRHGVIRLRVSLSIYDRDVFNYAAWRECNLFVDCPDIAKAKKFRVELENAVTLAGDHLKLEVKGTKTMEGNNGKPPRK